MKNDKIKVSFGVLDFNKPIESKDALESIRKNALFDTQIIYMSDGGRQDYVWELYKMGLIDKLILSNDNVGCGYATEALFAACDTDYMIYFQNDQILDEPISQNRINMFIDALESKDGIGAIGLAGAHVVDMFCERAFIINVKFYNSIPKTHGGPGPYNHLKYNEQCVQEYFKENNLKFLVTNPVFVKDHGLYSIRDLGEGGYWVQRTDNKKLWCLVKPSKFNPIYPDFTPEEEKEILENGWIDGKVPEKSKKHVFEYWPILVGQDEKYVSVLRKYFVEMN